MSPHALHAVIQHRMFALSIPLGKQNVSGIDFFEEIQATKRPICNLFQNAPDSRNWKIRG